MTLTLVTVGTRGDVQPYVALGLGLKAAGYEVRIAAPAALCGLIAQYGLKPLPIHAVDPQAFLARAGTQTAAGRGMPIRQLAALLREARPMFAGFIEDVWRASQGSDAIITGTIFYGAQDSAAKLGIPCIYAFLHPVQPTTAFPSPLFPRLPLNAGLLNLLTHKLTQQLMWQAFRPVVNNFRRRLGLAPQPVWGPYRALSEKRSLVLFGFSPTVVPQAQDWPRNAHVTGYWTLEPPSDWRPPEALDYFLASGPPPVYIGFGSMTGERVIRATRLALEAARSVGRRVILGSSPNGIEPDTVVLRVGDVPHGWLFPRVAAAIHHAGAGTAGAALRAGIPSLAIPFIGDQPFWAERLRVLGAGETADSGSLTSAALSTKLARMLADKGLLERAAQLGHVIRAEDGVRKAVALISEHLARR